MKVCENPGCSGCPLARKFPQNTFVEPKPGSGLDLVIAEAPGADESIQGVPLVGMAGKWFDALCRKARIPRESLTLTNTIQCRPPDNVYPLAPDARSYISPDEARAAIEHCRAAHLQPLIDSRPWERVLLLGDWPLRLLTGRQPISRWRGSPLALLGETKTRAIPTLHPAYIARDQLMFPVVANDLKKAPVVPPEHYNILPSLADVQAFKAREFAFDIESNPATGEITLLGLSAQRYHAIVVPFSGAYIPELKRIFANATAVYGQNVWQFDIPKLADNGVKLPAEAVVWDIMLLHHLLFPQFSGEARDRESTDTGKKTSGGHGLEFISSQFTNKPSWKAEGLGQPLYWEWRNAHDTDVTWQVGPLLRMMAEREDLILLYKLVATPLAEICYRMQERGIRVDPSRLEHVRTKFLGEMAERERALPTPLRTRFVPKRKREPAPPGTLGKSGKPVKFVFKPIEVQEVPWRSTQTVQKWLYEELGLPVQLHVKTQKPTSDKIALDKLITRGSRQGSPHVPALEALRRLRQLDELVSTFTKGDGVGMRAGRAHPNFNVHGTACLDGATLVVTSNLRWKPIQDVVVGDELIGFEEFARFRCLKPAKVTAKHLVRRPSYRVSFENGTSVIATDNHGWLKLKRSKPQHSTYSWCDTIHLEPGDAVGFWRSPWQEQTTKTHGYIQGFLDGEGCVHKRTGSLHFSQNTGSSLAAIKEALDAAGYRWSETNSYGRLKHVYVSDCLRVLGETCPARLLERGRFLWDGRRAFGEDGPQKVVSIEPLGIRDAVGLTTTTATIIAEGFLTHNSGRLSSSEPNLQNIPEAARYIYVPSHTDWCFVEADYSSGENRLTAWFANDTDRLVRLAKPGFSEHKYYASLFFGVPYEEVVKDNSKDAPYGKAKRITHGVNYGMGPRKLANLYDLNEREVRDLIFKWKQANRLTVEWQERVIAQAKADGVLRTPFSRKRWFYCVAPETRTLTTDLQWLPVGSLKRGDNLIAFDEHLAAKAGITRYRPSVVTHTELLESVPRYAVTTNRGTVIATPNHGWAVRLQARGSRHIHRCWLTTECLRPGDEILFFTNPWTQERSYEAGHFRGLLEGEGTVGNQGRGDIRFSQKPGSVLERTIAIAKAFGLRVSEPRPTKTSACAIRFSSGAPRSALEIIGRFQPLRLRDNARGLWDGVPVWGNTTMREVAVVEKIERVADGPVVALSTSTKTLLTEGLLSHNTQSLATEALSFLPQSTLADVTFRAMIGVYYERIGWPLELALRVTPLVEALPRPSALLLQVHDSLLVECPRDQREQVVETLRRVMEQPWPELGGFSLPVEIKVGEPGASWAELEPAPKAPIALAA